MEIDFCPVDQMAWVRADNQHRAIAEEIILKELIYILMNVMRSWIATSLLCENMK